MLCTANHTDSFCSETERERRSLNFRKGTVATLGIHTRYSVYVRVPDDVSCVSV